MDRGNGKRVAAPLTVPLFTPSYESYIDAGEFKTALRALDRHYDGLPQAIKQLGVLAFAAYPPSGIDNAITALWDKHMRSDWREPARRTEANLGAPRDRDTEQQTVAQLNRKIENAERADDENAPPSTRDLDYMVHQRWVPAKRASGESSPRMSSKPVRPSSRGFMAAVAGGHLALHTMRSRPRSTGERGCCRSAMNTGRWWPKWSWW